MSLLESMRETIQPSTVLYQWISTFLINVKVWDKQLLHRKVAVHFHNVGMLVFKLGLPDTMSPFIIVWDRPEVKSQLPTTLMLRIMQCFHL